MGYALPTYAPLDTLSQFMPQFANSNGYKESSLKIL